MARVLIVGCGDIGLGLVKQLLQGGHDVTVFKRSPLAETVPNLDLVFGDITVASDLNGLPTNFDQVFVILSASERSEASYCLLYEQGIDNLLSHFATNTTKANGRHWLFVSSTSVYGQNRGEWVDEDSPTEPAGFNGKALLQAEQRILVANPGNTVVRFSGIYGPGREQLLKRIKSNVPVQADPPCYTNRIHRDDCIGVLAWLFERRLAGELLQQIYLATDDEPAPIAEIAAWLVDRLKCPAIPTKTDTNNTGQNKRCSNRRLLDLGYKFLYGNYRAGFGALLDASAEHK
jgi:nucleoside-diphosphate-sugar epimerase